MPLWVFVSYDLFVCIRDFSFFLFATQLDESKDFEERKMIRAAMRDLRKRKRGNSKKALLLLGSHETDVHFVFL